MSPYEFPAIRPSTCVYPAISADVQVDGKNICTLPPFIITAESDVLLVLTVNEYFFIDITIIIMAYKKVSQMKIAYKIRKIG
jgi:hypothetical protein